MKRGRKRGDELWIVYISTFPPRKCGIATFTEDLTHSLDEMFAPTIKSKVVAMNPDEVVRYNYPRRVISQITQTRQQEYIEVAEQINRLDEVQMVNIQHEFGIFGGEWGSHLMAFLEALSKPVAINFHTVLPDPGAELRQTVLALAERVDAVIVMTGLSKKILIEEYGIAGEIIHVIPHGIHPHPYTSSDHTKAALGFSGKVVLSTFGMLSRNKGLEYVIEALPEVVSRYPDFVYIILGATHPTVLKEEGESYRNYLIQRIYDLGLYDHVKLYNKYFPLDMVLSFLRATDIYIAPSLDPAQAVSGTLSYALGTGRPVISTAFAQAREAVAEDMGILVDFRNPKAYTDAILRLLESEKRRLDMGMKAYFKTRPMTWPNVAVRYARVFSGCAQGMEGIGDMKILPKIKLDHLIRLTDTFGIIQFAKFSKPDEKSGYTLDDNARALAAAAIYYGKLHSESNTQPTSPERLQRQLLRLMETYLGFISFVSRADGHFQNFVDEDRTPNRMLNEQNNPEDAVGRALYALALTTTIGSIPKGIRTRAYGLLRNEVRKGIRFQSPRAIAGYIKTLQLLVDKHMEMEGIDLEGTLREYCDKLASLYERTSTADWPWFEHYLTYANGVLPEALLLGYKVTGEANYLQVGKESLDFLIKECFSTGRYLPIGQDGWYRKGEKRNLFDQQPEDVAAMVCALGTCYELLRDEDYLHLMYRAFYWFLGDNSLGQMVYDRVTGGCYDGVGKRAVNLNQGAESTIVYLLARLAF
ncbi:glycosyltransferase [Chloroflexota bacterium]